MFHRIDCIENRVGTMLVIDGEGSITVLHLVSGSVIPQQRVSQWHCLGG
jgi:hypothetical protein